MPLILNADTGASMIQDNTVNSAKIVDGSVTGADTAFANSVPCFSAYSPNVQSISTTWVKKLFETKEFDTTNAFDNVTNHRFQPTKAGYYHVTGQISYGGNSQGVALAIYKNGVEHRRGAFSVAYWITIDAIVYLNGTTDYVELWAYSGGPQGTSNAAGSSANYFQAHLIVGA